MKLLRLTFIFFMAIVLQVNAQDYDILIKNGHVIDPKNEIDGVMDVAIKDKKIAKVTKNIKEKSAKKVIDAEGLIVTPGLIDIHGHHFFGTESHRDYNNSFSSLPPDGFTFRAGVTTVADAGSPGWKNFQTYKEHVINRSKTRVLVFINIVGEGMSGVSTREQDTTDMSPKMTAMIARQNPEIIGVKIAHYRGHEWGPYKKAVQAAEIAKIPVMVDLGGADPALPLSTLLLDVLRPGDILTHMYGGDHSGHGPKEGTLNADGKVWPHWFEAQEKGLIFDVGHGGGSFLFRVAVPATQQGFYPNTISTDLHTGSMNAGMKDMLNVVSKMMNLGMSLQEAITASTWKPAQVIQREDLGHLSEGAEADLAIFNLHEGQFGFIDSSGAAFKGSKKLETELTLRAGRIVWDLNGIGAKNWE
ncbi:amidohydrolase/deacetylase family metallohydrolase [Cyclobacterium marinum]|uniref:amidohydrolase/deacetylase family metallohydrolase n=1 Tax=Cyclobacterium marinum TaxID=104 RepID=UPI0011ED623D|nr:amidohydrolase/deacetylase family metallohydrolase [Cyclobacterium marinum]MBI0401223.1 amidohydrolase/deacetylase family metallohydrolase [Cyclobacterium marinum]